LYPIAPESGTQVGWCAYLGREGRGRSLLRAGCDGWVAARNFFVYLRTMTETPSWQMQTLAYHECVPGHHLQIATAMGIKGLPLIRQEPMYTAYAEGWALYAERLAAEMGVRRR
jgi:uncharacterized protein (DUF885 family)